MPTTDHHQWKGLSHSAPNQTNDEKGERSRVRGAAPVCRDQKGRDNDETLINHLSSLFLLCLFSAANYERLNVCLADFLCLSIYINE